MTTAIDILDFLFGHKWQARGQNGYGTISYRVCLRCGKAQRLVSNIGECYRLRDCDRDSELDAQFDKNNNFIFNNR